MKDPKISIVTPSFNQGNYIEDAILSVLNQNYSNFEHIIIDGVSKDNTIEILKKYEHLKWISEKDEGQSDALNKGFKRSTGDIIGWLNSDDYYLQGAFDIIKNRLMNDVTDAVYGDYILVDKNKKTLREMIVQEPSKIMSKFICFVPSTTFFFKRKIIDSNIFIDKNMYIVMDKEYFANLLSKNYKFEKIDKFLAKFRLHEMNKSFDTWKIKKIRQKEGLIIYNRYSKLKLPNNFVGIILYAIMNNINLIYRFICRIIGFGIYSKIKKYKIQDRYI